MRVNAQVMLLTVLVAGCVHGSSAPRPARHISYWEALSELHPADAVAAARTPSETQFAEALEYLMSGDIEKAEEQFARLRTSASDSVIRAGSRVVYTATLQYQEKWQTLAALKGETPQSVADLHDLASIELWADAFKNVPAKVATFRSSTGRLNMSISAVGTPLVPVRIQDKVYNFWLDTGSSLTMLASDVARELGISPLVKDTLEIVTSTGRVKAQPALVTQLIIGPLAVTNAPAMIVNEAMMQMGESRSGLTSPVKIDGIIGFDIIRQVDIEIDYSDGILRLRNPAMSRPDANRNMFWVGLPVIRILSVDGIPLHFGLDTGAQLTFVTETLLDKLQLQPARMESRRVGGLGGEVSLRAPVLPDLKVLVRGFPILFRGAFVRAPVYQVLASLDGVLGGDLWNSGIVRIDMTNGVFAIRRARNYE
jgi:hypothetical protein